MVVGVMCLHEGQGGGYATPYLFGSRGQFLHIVPLKVTQQLSSDFLINTIMVLKFFLEDITRMTWNR